jgi:hypothetical protein
MLLFAIYYATAWALNRSVTAKCSTTDGKPEVAGAMKWNSKKMDDRVAHGPGFVLGFPEDQLTNWGIVVCIPEGLFSVKLEVWGTGEYKDEVYYGEFGSGSHVIPWLKRMPSRAYTGQGVHSIHYIFTNILHPDEVKKFNVEYRNTKPVNVNIHADEGFDQQSGPFSHLSPASWIAIAIWGMAMIVLGVGIFIWIRGRQTHH